jgi:hypothetical protein
MKKFLGELVHSTSLIFDVYIYLAIQTLVYFVHRQFVILARMGVTQKTITYSSWPQTYGFVSQQLARV